MYVLQNVLHFLTINVPAVPPIHTGLYTEQYFHLMSKYNKLDLHEAVLLNVIDKYIRPKPMKNKIFCPH